MAAPVTPVSVTVRPWPRLLSEGQAADYLSIGATTLRALGIRTRRMGRRVLYDIRDLDRFVDLMDGQPLQPVEQARATEDEERRFFEKRRARGRD